jgi:hypothetical protein
MRNQIYRKSLRGGEEMQKRILYSVIILTLALASVSLPSALADDKHSNPKSQLTPASCGDREKLVINVVQKVLNDPDSGIKGNIWAYDNFTRQIQVWNVTKPGDTSTSYCAIASYEGHFITQKGQATPNGTSTFSDNETGEFKGGFRATIIGTFLNPPGASTKGFIGTTDCQHSTSSSCTGYVQSWTTLYFGSIGSFTLNWWGWTYHNECGTWVNAITGTKGEIVTCTNGDHGDQGGQGDQGDEH